SDLVDRSFSRFQPYVPSPHIKTTDFVVLHADLASSCTETVLSVVSLLNFASRLVESTHFVVSHIESTFLCLETTISTVSPALLATSSAKSTHFVVSNVGHTYSN